MNVVIPQNKVVDAKIKQCLINEVYHTKGGRMAWPSSAPELLDAESAKLYFDWVRLAAVGGWNVEHAIYREFGELLESLGTLWFKPNEACDPDNAVMELTDLLFFFLTQTVANVGTAEDSTMGDFVYTVSLPNTNHLTQLSHCIRIENHTQPFLAWVCLAAHALNYVNACQGKGNDEILVNSQINGLFGMYHIKYALNMFRVEMGLFTVDGYKKSIWGHEDNYELMLRIQQVLPNFTYYNFVSGQCAVSEAAFYNIVKEALNDMAKDYVNLNK